MSADSRRLVPISQAVVRALEYAPRMIESIMLYDTRSDLRQFYEQLCSEFPDEGGDPGRADMRKFLDAPGLLDHARLHGKVLELYHPETLRRLITIATGLDEQAALAAHAPIARAVGGGTPLPHAEHRTLLHTPDEVAALAHELADLAAVLEARFEPSASTDERTDLVGLAGQIVAAYQSASNRNDAMLVRFALV